MEVLSSGVNIHVEQRSGREDEPTLVFLHYWGGSSRTWDRVIAALPGRYPTIATDHRGWGASDAPADGYAIADLAIDAQRVIAALGLQRYVLVGHSMGGKVAQWIASRRPAGLAGVVLVAPSPPSPMVLPDEQRAAMAHAYDTRESIEWVLDNVLTGKGLDAEARAQVIADSLRGAAPAKLAWPTAAMLEDISADVVAINVPVLVVSGECDQVDRIETLKSALLPKIAGARMHVLPGVGHLSPLEAPKALAAVIDAFVTERVG